MPKKVLVIANGEPPSAQLFHHLLSQHDYLVAVDGGFHTCLKYGIEPQLLIGDFDSVSDETRKKFSHIPQKHTPDQDKCDLEKTLIYLFDSCADEIAVCGAIGKRLDHTLTNVCLLSRYPGKIKFETDSEVCFALAQSSVLTCKIGQTLSLIPVSTEVQNVFTSGLKWELTGHNLNKYFVSISNICLRTQVSINFEKGDLVVCLSRQI